MDNKEKLNSFGLDFTQIAWVAKNVEIAKTFFQEILQVVFNILLTAQVLLTLTRSFPILRVRAFLL